MNRFSSPVFPPGTPLTEEQFSMLGNLLGSVHDFCHQLLGVLYVLEPPHTNNDLIKCLRPNGRLSGPDLVKWRLDPGHGLLHGLITSYFAVKLASEWTVPVLRENVVLQRLIASCLVHDYARIADGVERHDQKLRHYFPSLFPETYGHTTLANGLPLIQADQIESLRHAGSAPTTVEEVLAALPDDTARFEVQAFHRFVRPALARLFRGRTAVWLRHGAEATDWRNRWSDQPMVAGPKNFWPNFYYPWPGFPGYWAIEVGELTPTHHKKPLVDFFFPCGLMTIDEYRACDESAAILSAASREHEIASGRIPLGEWIFVFQDLPLEHDRYLVMESGGIVTVPILANIIDVADAIYAKLYSIG